MVGGLNQIQVMLNDDHRVALVHQLLEDLYELVHVCNVQAGGGLIQDIDGLAGWTAGELCRKLYTLCLAS